MPQTIYGIGTAYRGTANRQVRRGVCRSCQRDVDLASYDTRLWFVVLFVPVIPLGRKRILEQCPACSFHYAVDIVKWEVARQLDVSGAADKFRQQQTAEAAMELHEQLIGYHQMAEAEEFRKMMIQKFSGSGKVHEYLGVVCSQLGHIAEGRGHLLKAHELRPDLPDARIGIAWMRMEEGKLDEARALLDFLEKPGAAQLYNIGPLDALADAYQRANHHRQALELYRRLIEELPHAAQHPEFRKKVARSERALNERRSILPKKKFRWFASAGGRGGRNKLAIAGAIVLLLAVAFGVTNEWIRRHRRVYVANGLAKPVTVSVDGVGLINVEPGTAADLQLKEGSYRAVVSGAVDEVIPFAIESGYWDRCFQSPLWIVNPGGAGVLRHTVAVYSRNQEPSMTRFVSGSRFHHFGDIDFQFRPPPEKMKVKSRERRVRNSVTLHTGSGAEYFHQQLANGRSTEAARFAHDRLKLRPDDEELLKAYASSLDKAEALAHFEELLKGSLNFRPVQVTWHRIYQNLIRNAEREERLTRDYEAMLAEDPKNSDLLYLRGRLSTERAEANEYFVKALAENQRNAFAAFALGYDCAIRGDFAGARPWLEKAVSVRPGEENFARLWRLTRLALGEHADVEKEIRRRLGGKNPNYDVLTEFALLMGGEKRTADADRQVQAHVRKAAHGVPASELKVAIASLRLPLYYAAGDFEMVEKVLQEVKAAPFAVAAAMHVAVERGEVERALGLPGAQVYLDNDPFLHLAISLAWELGGRLKEATASRKTAVEKLLVLGRQERRAAALLQADTTPSLAQLDELVLEFRHKALVCAVLARQHSEKGAEFASLARALNVEPVFPTHLIQKATAEVTR